MRMELSRFQIGMTVIWFVAITLANWADQGNLLKALITTSTIICISLLALVAIRTWL